MIKIISGYTGPGGSTEAFINLTNEFNKRGYECCFYGVSDNPNNSYPEGKCRFELGEPEFNKEDRVICHLMSYKSRPDVHKLILSCHEQSDFPLNRVNLYPFDKIHCVAQHQWEYHKVNFPHFIVGNIYDEWLYNKYKLHGNKLCAGVIGLIYPNKQTHVSIQRAIDDGFDNIVVCGKVTNEEYFNEYVRPLLSDKAEYLGHMDKKQIYTWISDLYISSNLECLPSVVAEAKLCGVKVHMDETKNYAKAKYWLDKDEVMNVWKKELEL